MTAWSTTKTLAGGSRRRAGPEGSSVGMARLRRGDGRMVDMEVTARQFRDRDGAARSSASCTTSPGRSAIEREMEELSARLLELSQGDELTGFQNRRGLIASGHRTPAVRRPRGCRRRGPLRRRGQRGGANDASGITPAMRRCRPWPAHWRWPSGRATCSPASAAPSSWRLPRPGEVPGVDAVTMRILRPSGRPRHDRVRGCRGRCPFGWTTRPAGERPSLAELMARADWAMLEAKEARRAARGLPAPLT